MAKNGATNRPRLPSPLDGPAANGPAANGPVASESSPNGSRSERREQRPPARATRFSIRFLMLVTLVVAIATAGYNGMNLGGERRIGALFFTLVSPVLVLVALGLAERWLRRRR